MQSIVDGVMSDDVAWLLNRSHDYSFVGLHGLSQPRIYDKVMCFIISLK